MANDPVNWIDVYGLKPLTKVRTGYGPQFGFKVLILDIHVDFDSQKYDYAKGKYIVTESYSAALRVGKKVLLGMAVEREACGEMELPRVNEITGRIIPGTGRTSSDVLAHAPWEFQVSVFNNLLFGKEDAEIYFGFASYFSAEFSLNLTE